MPTEYLEIKFSTTTQKSTKGRLTVPAMVCKLLKLGSGELIHLKIERANGESLVLEKRLTSGTEIVVGMDTAELESSERLTITASRSEG
jgi:hypothetical protein